MQTKESIIERLLEEKHITVKEAVILLQANLSSYGQIRYLNPDQSNTPLLPWIRPNEPNPNFPYTIKCDGHSHSYNYTSGSTTTNSNPEI
jgi:hypothetical protein